MVMNTNSFLIIETIAIFGVFCIIGIATFEFIRIFFQRFVIQYSPKKYIMTRTEAIFFYALQKSIGIKYFIATKVRVGDIVNVSVARSKLQDGTFWDAFNPIVRMHADFVICDKRTLQMLLVIELDDRTHTTQYKQKRNDIIKNKVYKKAHIPLLRIKAGHSYDTKTLLALIEEKLTDQTYLK